MGFQQGLSGLAVSGKALDAIGNNVANANTIGFKAAQAQFADVFAASLSGSGASQVGIGSTVGGVAQLFTQGNITSTSNPLDIAVNGSGFYRMQSTSGITYTRSGQFQLDKNGYIINGAGLQLTGYPANASTGQISAGKPEAMRVNNSNIEPKATSSSTILLNLDSRSSTPTTMTSGSLTGAFALSSVTIPAAGAGLDLKVDGINVSIMVPTATGAASYRPGELASKLEALINTELTGMGYKAGVDVTAATDGRLTITSTSKGSEGSIGEGSSVTLNGTGGAAAALIFGNAPTVVQGSAALGTAGSYTSGVALPDPVVIGSGESLVLTVDGVKKTINLPSGTYAVATSAFQTMLQNTIEAEFPGGVTVAAPAATSTGFSITSNAGGIDTSSVLIEDATAGIQDLLGPTTVAGNDNFSVISEQTPGKLTGSMTFSSTVPATVNGGDTLDVVVDGTAVVATLTGGNYDDSGAGAMIDDLALDIQQQINSALATAGSTARVTVNNISGKLQIVSDTLGPTSSVRITGGSATATGTLATDLFGDNLTTIDGDQVETIDSLGFTYSTAQTVYDSQGGSHSLGLYFIKTSEVNKWKMYSTLDNGEPFGPEEIEFTPAGVLKTPNAAITLPGAGLTYPLTSSGTAAEPDPITFTLDLRGTTQYGVAFGVNSLSQDGYASGQLSGISVDSDGTIKGRFSNGQSKAMGQLVLVSFNNPNGLRSLGGNQWIDTAESGPAIVGTPGSGRLGVIQSAAVEESNVDLTAELVAMITQQRVYQANAQTIKTQDQVLSTLVNLR